MEVSAKQIAEHLGGEIVGNPDVTVSSVARIESGKPGTLCFLANPKYEHYLYTCKASIVLINKSFEPKEAVSPTLVRVDNAYEAVASLLDLLNTMKAARRRGRAWSSHVAFSARLGKGVYVGANNRRELHYIPGSEDIQGLQDRQQLHHTGRGCHRLGRLRFRSYGGRLIQEDTSDRNSHHRGQLRDRGQYGDRPLYYGDDAYRERREAGQSDTGGA